MENYSVGDVIIAPVPFSNNRSIKKRPLIVVSSMLYHACKTDVLAVPLTTNLSVDEQLGEFTLNEPQAIDLRPSAVKAKFHTIDRRIIQSLRGALAMSDQMKLKVMIKKVFDEQLH